MNRTEGKGTATPGDDLEMTQTSPTSLVVDAKHGVGMVVGFKIMRNALKRQKNQVPALPRCITVVIMGWVHITR